MQLPTNKTNGIKSVSLNCTYIIAFLSIFAIFSACQKEKPKDTLISVNSVAVSPTSNSIAGGATITLTTTVLPANAHIKAVTWSSSDAKKASVSADGVVKGLDIGTVIITVTTLDGNKTASASITVTSTYVPVSGVTVSPSSTTIAVGATATLVGSVSPTTATFKTIAWTSSDDTKATVTANGVVTGVAAGAATITATADGVTATTNVNIK